MLKDKNKKSLFFFPCLINDIFPPLPVLLPTFLTSLLSNFLGFLRVSQPAVGFLNCGRSMYSMYLENTPAQSLTPNQLHQNIWGWDPGHEIFEKAAQVVQTCSQV